MATVHSYRAKTITEYADLPTEVALVQPLMDASFAEHERDALHKEEIARTIAWRIARRPATQRFDKAVEKEERALLLIDRFHQELIDVREAGEAVVSLPPPSRPPPCVRLCHEKFKALVSEPSGWLAQRIIVDAGRIMRAGKVSYWDFGMNVFSSKHKKTLAREIPTYYFDRSMEEAMDRLVKNHGYLLATDEERRALHQFILLLAFKQADKILRREDVHSAFEKLSQTSMPAARLVARVYLNHACIGEEEEEHSVAQSSDFLEEFDPLIDVDTFVYCARMINQWENHGLAGTMAKSQSERRKDNHDALRKLWLTEEHTALTAFVNSYRQAMQNNCNYDDMKASFAKLLQKAPSPAEELAISIGKKYSDLAGPCDANSGGRMIIEITNNNAIIEEVLQQATAMKQKREDMLDLKNDPRAR